MAALNASKRIMVSYENLLHLEKENKKKKMADGGTQITIH